MVLSVERRQNLASVPDICYPGCENARIEALRVGQSQELCETGSAFQITYSDCKECVPDDNQRANEQLDAVFGRYLAYCNGTPSASNSPPAPDTSTQKENLPASIESKPSTIAFIPRPTETSLFTNRASTSSNKPQTSSSLSSSSFPETDTKSTTKSTIDVDSQTPSKTSGLTFPATSHTSSASLTSTEITTSTQAPSPSDDPPPATPGPTSTLVVGGILSSLFFLVLIALALYFYRRRHRPHRKSQRNSQQHKRIEEIEIQHNDTTEMGSRSISLPPQEIDGRPAPRVEMDVDGGYVEMDVDLGCCEMEVPEAISRNGSSDGRK